MAREVLAIVRRLVVVGIEQSFQNLDRLVVLGNEMLVTGRNVASAGIAHDGSLFSGVRQHLVEQRPRFGGFFF